jgi:hypothetical protein
MARLPRLLRDYFSATPPGPLGKPAPKGTSDDRRYRRRSERAAIGDGRRPQLEPGAGASGGVRVVLPGGRVADHEWQALMPSELLPLYAALDRQRLGSRLGRDGLPAMGDEEGRLLEYLSPRYAAEEKAYYELDERYYTTLAVGSWPDVSGGTHPGPEIWIELLTTLAQPMADGTPGVPKVTLSLHHNRIPPRAAVRDLRRKAERLELQIREARTKPDNAREVAALEERQELFRRQYESVVRGHQTEFHVSAYIRLGAARLKDLRRAQERLEDVARRMGVGLVELPAEQRRGFISSMPYGADEAYAARERATQLASDLFPLITKPRQEPGGVIYGLHYADYTPVLMTPFHANGTVDQTMILGQKGSGKTFWLRTHLGRMAMLGTQLLVVDPLGDFSRFFARNGGQVIKIAPGSRSHVNPFRREWEAHTRDYESIERKIDRLMPMFRLLMPTFFEEAKGVLSGALGAFYQRWGTEERLMADFIEELKAYRQTAAGELSEESERLRRRTIDWLAQMCLGNGPYADLFAHRTNIEVRSKRILFDLSSNGEAQSGDLALFSTYMAVTMATQMAMRSTDRKLLVVDEIHRLYAAQRSVPAVEQMIYDLARTHRHWNTALVFATQCADEDMGSLAQSTALRLTSTWVLLGAPSSVIEQMARLVGEGANLDLMHRWLNVPEGDLGRESSYKKALIQLSGGMSLPIYSIGFRFEREEDDKESGVAQARSEALDEPDELPELPTGR